MINVRIKEGYKPQHHFGSPYYHGELHSIEDSGCWVLMPDQSTNAAFSPDELLLPKNTTKKELLELIDENSDQIFVKKLITSLLRHRARN